MSFMRIKHSLSIISGISFICSYLLFGCNNTSAPSTEMNPGSFTEQIENFGINLVAHSKSEWNKDTGFVNTVGSESYSSLSNKAVSNWTFKSSKNTTYGYTINESGSFENVKMTSTADQTPEIYTFKGNKKYPTGKCSNVTGLQAKSLSNITIKDCVFENMSGIHLWNCSDITIQNCYFMGAENGVHMAECSNINVINCTFEMNSTGLTDYYQGVYLGDGNSLVTVSNCYFKADGDIKKPYRLGSTTTDVKSSADITFQNCFSEGHFRSGFQNIDGEATLDNCTFIFDDYQDSYNYTIVIDAGSDKTYTTLKNCIVYSMYRKRLTSSTTTVFENCSYNLFAD